MLLGGNQSWTIELSESHLAKAGNFSNGISYLTETNEVLILARAYN